MSRIAWHDPFGACIGWEAFMREAAPISDGRKLPVLICLLSPGIGDCHHALHHLKAFLGHAGLVQPIQVRSLKLFFRIQLLPRTVTIHF